MGGKYLMYLQEVGWESINWIDLAQDKPDACEYTDEPSGSIKCREHLDYLRTS